MKRKLAWVAVVLAVAAGAAAWFAIARTRNRVQIEFDIQINRQAVYLSAYAEPPQFAIWLEDPDNGERQTVFVTYRISRGDWEGKADVPVALPHWHSIFRGATAVANEREIAVSGATPKEEFFRVRAEVRPGSRWTCRIEMNLAGDYNEYYPRFNPVTMHEDEFACGQPALLYNAHIIADEGLTFTPRLEAMSLWKDGVHTLAPVDSTITSANRVFDQMTIEIVRPKPRIIEKTDPGNQDVLKTQNIE